MQKTLEFIAGNYQLFFESQKKKVQKGSFSRDFHIQSFLNVSVEFLVFLQGLASGTVAPSLPGHPDHTHSDSNGTSSHEQAFHQTSITFCHRDNLFFMYN